MVASSLSPWKITQSKTVTKSGEIGQSQRSFIDVTPPNTLNPCLSWVRCGRCRVAAQSANYHLQMLVSFGVLLLLILTKARNDQQQFNRPYGNDLSPNHPDYFSKGADMMLKLSKKQLLEVGMWTERAEAHQGFTVGCSPAVVAVTEQKAWMMHCVKAVSSRGRRGDPPLVACIDYIL
ncbi:unnamed protein product [Toxocara canis]|uniref:SCP domain-containing protein n=1 Tax=Toxocara canis TaxID=6265 RepID=A0A183VBM0_TOXCA|nr:unnamed protein product [Toxocara canis]